MTWQEMLKNNVTTADEVKDLLHLSDDDVKKLDLILEKFPMSVTQYYLSLIDPSDPSDPIRKLCIPSISETDLSGNFDTSGEASNTIIAGMQHKYKQTALILSTSRCASYCRHCFRKRLVGLSDDEIMKHFDEMSEYIKQHKEITNVLISGGDSFVNNNQVIEQYLKTFCDIDHLDLIRFGTRTPVFLPQRISEDQELLDILEFYNKKKQIYIVTHFNHEREITPEAIKAVQALMKIGIPVKNQTVLLKGINDDPLVLSNLLKRLTRIGVIPYYIFQCRPVTGVKAQFQVSIETAYDIIEKCKSLQNGQGKCFKYCMSHETGKIEIVGKLENGEMIFKYNQAKYEKDEGRIFTKKLT
ncbi:MAG: KamA family radical SAM protein, partial [Erysipelotrichaceae bacterium]